MLELPRLLEPRISVVICNYNYVEYLEAALESVLTQTRPAYEVIVVDDGSTDDSRQLLQSFAGRGVKTILRPNGGQVAAYNTAFEHTTGDVVLFLDADDLLAPEALERIAPRFERGVAKVHFRLCVIDARGRPTGASIPRALSVGDVARRMLARAVPHCSPPASGNAYRRDVLAQLFPLPVDDYDRHGADYFCIYGSTLFGSVAACTDALGAYRVHSASLQTLSFGNASHHLDKELRERQRYARYRAWIAERSRGQLELPAELLAFSLEKGMFARAALDTTSERTARRVLARWHKLLLSLYAEDTFSAREKLGLTLWSLLVVAAPRPLAFRAARYVCNPAARSPGGAMLDRRAAHPWWRGSMAVAERDAGSIDRPWCGIRRSADP